MFIENKKKHKVMIDGGKLEIDPLSKVRVSTDKFNELRNNRFFREALTGRYLIATKEK